MTKICDEFERSGGNGDGRDQSVSEKILTLMQELQQYGQPPADLAAETVSLMGLRFPFNSRNFHLEELLMTERTTKCFNNAESLGYCYFSEIV